MGLAEGWTVFGIVLVAGGLAIDPGAGLVLLGVAPLGFGPASHGGFATVDVVPLGCDVPPDAAVVLEVGTPLALEPVPPAVEVVLPGEVEVVEFPEAVVLLLAGVHGATVGVVPLGFWVLVVVPRVPPVTAPGLPATPGVPCVGAGAPIELVPGCEAGVPVVGCVVVVVPG